MKSLHKMCLIAAQTLVISTATLTLSTTNVQAANLPSEYNPKSKTAIKYEDLDFLLKQTVLKLGRSDHKPAPKPRKLTGSNVRFDNPLPSRLEGNRVLFHQNREELISVSAEIRDAVLNIPTSVPIDKLNRNEQLAYWLNLHNIIVYHEIASRYPITQIAKLLEPCPSKTSFRCEQRYSLAGQMISLDDIERHVITNWDDPLVIYGFYMGAVGTPNVRGKAFSGKSVYSDLEKNAVDFIHSVRGTRVWNAKQLRVSGYYKRMAKFFPNFETDLLAHVRDYSEPQLYAKLHRISKIKPNIDDWHIADLYNGHLNDPAGIGNVSRISAGGQTSNGMPAHVSQFLSSVVKRNKTRQAQVSVEEVIIKK